MVFKMGFEASIGLYELACVLWLTMRWCKELAQLFAPSAHSRTGSKSFRGGRVSRGVEYQYLRWFFSVVPASHNGIIAI